MQVRFGQLRLLMAVKSRDSLGNVKIQRGGNAYLFLSWDSWCPTELWQRSSSRGSGSALVWDLPYNRYERDIRVHLRYFASNGEMNQLICMFGIPHFSTLQGDTYCLRYFWSINTFSRCTGAPFRLILNSFSVGHEVSKIRTYVNEEHRHKINIIFKKMHFGEKEIM
jgi:hypothetical protein